MKQRRSGGVRSPLGLGIEQLERRELLDATGLLWGIDSRLSISFVPDGASVGNQSSSLFSHFATLGDEHAWQEAILRGFQTWARHTNNDIALVEDDGSGLGISGATTGDERFGDIRVAAIPMQSDVFATSIPTTEFVDGTWVGDVFFNTNASLENLDELFAVALHEAGHVLGLEHTSDAASPMHRHGIPDSTTPTAADIEAVQNVFSARQADLYELIEQSETPNIELDGEDSAVPAILFAELESPDDVDQFLIEEVDDLEGSLAVRLITDEISLLRAQLSVFDSEGNLIRQGQPANSDATELLVELTNGESDEGFEDLLVRVESQKIAPYDVGSYTIVVQQQRTDLPQAVASRVEEVSRTRIRSIGQGSIRAFFGMEFDDDDELFAEEDDGTDDDVGEEVEIERTGLGSAKRFVTTDSISRRSDVDRHRITVPNDFSAGEPMSVSLVSLSDEFRGEVLVQDLSGQAVAATHVINNEFATILQVPGIEPGQSYAFAVRTHVQSEIPTGNYELVVEFGGELAQANSLARKTIDDQTPEHRATLRVDRTQLFQFGLSSAEPGNHVLLASVLDSEGNNVVELVSSGELATTSFLLVPGEYEVVTTTEQPIVSGNISYELTGRAVDQPLGPEPVDPTEDPFSGWEWLDRLLTAVRIAGDVDGDGEVTFADFLRLSANFGKADAERSEGDLNDDLAVDFADFLILSNNFGQQNPEAIT